MDASRRACLKRASRRWSFPAARAAVCRQAMLPLSAAACRRLRKFPAVSRSIPEAQRIGDVRIVCTQWCSESVPPCRCILVPSTPSVCQSTMGSQCATNCAPAGIVFNSLSLSFLIRLPQKFHKPSSLVSFTEPPTYEYSCCPCCSHFCSLILAEFVALFSRTHGHGRRVSLHSAGVMSTAPSDKHLRKSSSSPSGSQTKKGTANKDKPQKTAMAPPAATPKMDRGYEPPQPPQLDDDRNRMLANQQRSNNNHDSSDDDQDDRYAHSRQAGGLW